MMRQHGEPALGSYPRSHSSPRHFTGSARSSALSASSLDAGLDERLHQLDRPAVQTQSLRPRCDAQPSLARARLNADGAGMMRTASGPNRFGQNGADAVAGRVAGREHADRPAAEPLEGFAEGAERLRPGDALTLSRPQQVEMTPSADHHRGPLDHRADRGRQPVRAVVAHAHHREPRSHRGAGPDWTPTVFAASETWLGRECPERSRSLAGSGRRSGRTACTDGYRPESRDSSLQ